VPGFIDTHLHIESSLVTPLEFDRCVLPHGVTTVFCDPHEIANVLGAAGIKAVEGR
jgi:adenine deaminase